MQGGELRSEAAAAAPADDAHLVAAVVCGERAALAIIYDRHASLLLALGVRILGDRAQAEDVLHDVFLEAWHQARQFDPSRGTLRAWLVTRMRSRALDRRGKVARATRLAETAAKESGAPAGEAIAGADRERVRQGVAGLPEDLAAVVDLAYFDGLSASEIAERIGIPIGTVKSRLARAIATLRQHLHPGGTP
jgi:RNA polymerase sigma-70 factor, ECF subfamily